jgi:PAS domain-containing protein
MCYAIVSDITERKQTEIQGKSALETLRTSEELYRSLFENMPNGFAYCEMRFDTHDNPADFTYLAVNSAFEILTGLKNVTGRNATEVTPGIREADPELLEIYGQVSKTGTPECFEIFINSMQMKFWISVYSLRQDYFAAVFERSD